MLLSHVWYQSASPNLAGQQLGGSWGVQHQYSASTVQNSLPKGSTEVLSGVRKRRMGLSVFIEHDSLESLCPWNVDCWELCFFLQPRMSLHGFCFYFPSVYGTVLLSCVEGRGVVLMDLGWVRISPEESKENAWAGLKGSVLRMEKFNITPSQHMYTYISMCVWIYIHTLISPPESISKVKQSAEAWAVSVQHVFVLRSRCLKKHYLYYKTAEKKAW